MLLNYPTQSLQQFLLVGDGRHCFWKSQVRTATGRPVEGGGKAMKSRITIFLNVLNKRDYLRLKVLLRHLR